MIKCATLAIKVSKLIKYDVSNSAMCSSNVVLSENCTIDDAVIIGTGSKLGKNFACGDGTMIGGSVTVAKDVVLGKHTCVPDGTQIGDGERASHWSKVEQKPPKSKAIAIIRPKPGFKYELKAGRCESVPRRVPKSPKMSDCAHIVDGEIDTSAMCSEGVTFEDNPKIGPDVFIEFGSIFGRNLHIAGGVQIGRFVYAGDEVHIFERTCVEDKLVLDDKTQIPQDSAFVMRDGKSRLEHVRAGMRWDLRNGTCVLIPNENASVVSGSRRVSHTSSHISHLGRTIDDTLSIASDEVPDHIVTEDDENNFFDCLNRKDSKNVFGDGGFAKCKARANVGTGNTINGEIYLDVDAHLTGGAFIAANSIVLANQKVRIGRDCNFADRVVIGPSTVINDNVKLDGATIETGVKVGNRAEISGWIKQKATIGERCVIQNDAVVERLAIVHADVIIGAKATVNENITIGAGSCIGNGVVINESLPRNTIVNRGATPKQKKNGVKAKIVSGKCL